MFERYSIEWYLVQDLKKNYKTLGEKAYKENEFIIKNAINNGIITSIDGVALYRINNNLARAF